MNFAISLFVVLSVFCFCYVLAIIICTNVKIPKQRKKPYSQNVFYITNVNQKPKSKTKSKKPTIPLSGIVGNKGNNFFVIDDTKKR